jgi:twinkle protein
VQPGFDWPWQSLTDATYGIRRKELYALGAGVGCGKTEVFKEIIVKTIKDGRPAGVIFLEEPPAHTVKVIAGKMVGRLFHIPGYDYKPEELSAAIDTLEGKLWVYDHFGAKGYDDVKQRIIFLVTVMGCKDIFLDHMTALVAGEEDERRALDYIMADLAGLAERHDFTLYYISHLSTPDGKPHEEGGRVYERHFTGSRALARWSHYMFALERDKQNPSKPTTFRILKDRYTGRGTGKTFGLGYDVESGTMVEVSLDDENPFDGEDDDV